MSAAAPGRLALCKGEGEGEESFRWPLALWATPLTFSKGRGDRRPRTSKLTSQTLPLFRRDAETRSPRRPLPSLRLTSSQKDFAARAEPKNLAVRTIRLACITAAAAVPDEPVTPVCPMLAGHEPHQILFDFFGILVLRQTKTLRQSDHVCIHHNAYVFMERVA
jgi:hypothetical protein